MLSPKMNERWAHRLRDIIGGATSSNVVQLKKAKELGL
jgi:hypothetical protein